MQDKPIPIVTGIEALKDQWRKAKLLAGDMRGLGRSQRFDIAERFGINSMKVAFDSIAPGNGKVEIEASITSGDQDCGSVYSIQDLLDEVKLDQRLFPGQEIEIQLIKVQWNKQGTDANRSNVMQSFIYKSK